MNAWLNISVLIISSVIFTYYYVRSVSPAKLEKRIGDIAYRRCGTDRAISMLFLLIMCLNYVAYYWYPLPINLPLSFPWSWWISVAIGFIIGLPSCYLMLLGLNHAGEEAIRPKPEHEMYSGVYRYIRHPQALGEFPLWWSIGFILNSPFLVLFSFIYVPVWYYLCVSEERDLVLRFGEPYQKYQSETGFWFPKLK